MTANHYSNGGVSDVNSKDIRCFEDPTRDVANTTTVAAGSRVSFKATNTMGHPGPSMVYMAKVPAGQTAATWDGSGNVWFKIFEEGPTISNGGLQWKTGGTEISATIPKSLPAGEYLLRGEQIALHLAQTVGGAQAYLSCAQLKVTGGGSGRPSPLVAFPGAYKAAEPGLKINIYGPV